MVIIAALVILFLIFFLAHKHAGPAHLAVIAGISVYEMFGQDFAVFIQRMIENSSYEIVDTCVYVALILVFPLILYIRSPHGGFFGLLRIAESLIFAIVVTALLSETLAKYFAFDVLAQQLSAFIMSIEGIVVLIGIISAYFDILLYHE